jgi:hypothetical protein
MGGVRTLAVLLALSSGCDAVRDASADPDGQAGESGAAGRPMQRGGNDAPSGAGDGGQTACSEPRGIYEAIYTPLSGTCGPFEAPARVPFDASTTFATFAAVDVTTEIVVQGCSLRVTQVVSDRQGAILERIVMDDLVIGEDDRIRGTATLTRFEGGAPTCTGTYAVELSRSTTTIGEAIGRDAGSAGAASEDAGAGVPEDVRAKVEYDCQQTVQCRVQRGETLPPDPFAQCIANTIAQLQARGDGFAAYVEAVSACQQFVICDYISCAQAQH